MISLTKTAPSRTYILSLSYVSPFFCLSMESAGTPGTPPTSIHSAPNYHTLHTSPPPPPSWCRLPHSVPSAQASVHVDSTLNRPHLLPVTERWSCGLGWPIAIMCDQPQIGQGHLGRHVPPQQRSDSFYLTSEPAPRLVSPGSRPLASTQAIAFRPFSPTTL